MSAEASGIIPPAIARDSEASARVSAGGVARVLGALAVGLAVASVGAWLLGVRFDEVMAKVGRVSRWTLVACAASAFVVVALQSLRWHLVMRPLLGLRYADALRAQLVGVAFNALLPARGGDLLRVQYLGRRTGKSRATILGSEIVDRWLDWWGWMPVLAVLALTSDLPRWMFSAVALFGGILVASAVAMVVLGRTWTPKVGSRAGDALRLFKAGIDAFGSKRTLVLALAIAPLPWLWEAAALLLAGGAFDVHLSFAMAFSVLIGFNVAMLIPSPGAIGSVETGGTAALVFFGVDQSNALAFMCVYHLTQLLPTVAAGAAIAVAPTVTLRRGRCPRR